MWVIFSVFFSKERANNKYTFVLAGVFFLSVLGTKAANCANVKKNGKYMHGFWKENKLNVYGLFAI